MDWWGELVQALMPGGLIEPIHWMGLATVVAFLVLVAVLLGKSRKVAAQRRDGSSAGSQDQAKPTDPGALLEGISLSPIDSVFPRRPVRFVVLVAVVAIAAWVAGYMLAPSPALFLSSEEWQIQPFYLAAHLVTLRLFINVFTRAFAAGVGRLKVSAKEALQGLRPILGIWGALGAAVIAAPLCWSDYQYLHTRYVPLAPDKVLGAGDYVMWGIWSVEWFINAFIWVLLVGFMVKNCLMIARYPFRAPIDVVLQEKHYRPFLRMSAQGSTVVLGFSLVTVGYIWVTEGALTDYLGLAITVALLVVCFVPPWLMLREKVEAAFEAQMIALKQGTGAILNGPELGGPGGRSVEERLDEAVSLLRMWHLQNLYGGLGRSEATAILVRLVAPAATIGWQVVQNHGEITKKLTGFLATLGS